MALKPSYTFLLMFPLMFPRWLLNSEQYTKNQRISRDGPALYVHLIWEACLVVVGKLFMSVTLSVTQTDLSVVPTH